MHLRLFFILYLLGFTISHADYEGIEFEGITVTHDYNQTAHKQFVIMRHIPKTCEKSEILTNEMVWTGNYANPKVPDECKSTFVHTTGSLQPMKLHDKLETYGELETLGFIQEMQTDKTMLLIDSRKEKWFAYMTIPGAINMPYYYFKYKNDYEFEFEYALKYLGVKILDEEEHYDFSDAKTILLFCNGPWCSQSPMMIDALLEIGYPPQKIKWYRGGMQSWLGAGMTSTRD